jgi:hypothetical protein
VVFVAVRERACRDYEYVAIARVSAWSFKMCANETVFVVKMCDSEDDVVWTGHIQQHTKGELSYVNSPDIAIFVISSFCWDDC